MSVAELTESQIELLKQIEPMVPPGKLIERREEVEELQKLGYVTGVRGSFNDGLPDTFAIGLSFKGFEAIGAKPMLYAHPERDATIASIKNEIASVPYAEDDFSFGDLIEEAENFFKWFWTRGTTSERSDEESHDDYLARRVREIKDAVSDPEGNMPKWLANSELFKAKYLEDPLGFLVEREISNALVAQQCAHSIQAAIVEQLIQMLAEARLGCQYKVNLKSEAKKEEEEVEPAA